MTPETTNKLHSLIKDVREHVSYFHELGVELVQPCQTNSGLTTLSEDVCRAEISGDILAPIHEEIGDCTRCPLHQGRTHVVHTEGNRKARLMFVGEAPGADEDAHARA